MFIYSEDGLWAVGCVERGIAIYFNRPVPAWAVQ